ncbi:Stf0 sulfotransferase [Nitrospirillum pindoramense]|uniref:Stf0 sulfotransferase n=2 Tax=Nitrospirillum amazonense TaxID=28077 RepID=A0A560HBG7_9PROT|nr:Stf0 sulfotransferase [Nitrospirillum amazonense]
MKLHPWHIDLLSTAEGAVAAAFPSPRFVRLIRQDLLGQAISLLRARQTGSYHSHIQEEKPATYDANAIDGIIRDLSRNRARWDMYFARIGVIPLLVTYEELCTDTFGVLTRIATFMGETVHHKDLVGMLPIRKQANSQSWEWRERYVRERGDINYLDRM